MAENIDITVDDNGAPAPKKKLKFNKLLIIPAIILILAVQTVAAYYTIQLFFFAGRPAAPAPELSEAQDSTMAETEKENKVKKGKSDTSEPGSLYEFKDVVVNPAGTMGRRYFVVSLSLEASDAKVLEELKAKDSIIRDALITLLTQKTLDYISDVINMEAIRTEIQQVINEKLHKGKIDKVYFTSYILQ